MHALANIVLRTCGIVLLVLGSFGMLRTAEVALFAEPAESWRQLLARSMLALLLLASGWRLLRPSRARAAARLRRRLLTLLRVLADQQLQREFKESSPLASLPVALLDDWRRAFRDVDDRAFAADELTLLRAFDGELEELARAVPETSGGEEDFELIASDPAWREVRERARQALAGLDHGQG